MKLFFDEVIDESELHEKLKNNNKISQDYKVAVIAYIFDDKNRIVFQRRGPDCRDEINKLEAIGGGVENSDKDFRDALKREIKEEIGLDANVEIGDFVIATYGEVENKKTGKNQAWVFLTYKAKLVSGKLQIAEPKKCIGYEYYKINEAPLEELSNGAQEIYTFICKKYGGI